MQNPNRETTSIRTATLKGSNDIKRIYSSAFANDEGEVISKLALELLHEDMTPQTISLLAEIDGSVCGHVAFSPVTVGSNENWQGYILAPLAVDSNYQQRGIGSALVEYGLQQLSDKGVNIVFVYGDPNYYGRFGFTAEAARNYKTPYSLQHPFGWQAVVLNEYIVGKEPCAIHCVPSLCNPRLW